MSDSTLSRRCSKCKTEFPLTPEFFNRDKSRKYGFCYTCKSCDLKRITEAHRKNPQTLRDAVKRYAQKHPERIKQQFQSWSSRNREHLRDYKNRAYHLDLVHSRAIGKANSQKRAARQRNLPNSFSAQDWECALDFFEHRCAYCGRPAGLWHTLAADHYIALSQPNCPGTVPTNIVPACHGVGGCNNEKRDLSPEVFLERKFGKKKAREIESRVEEYFREVE